MSAPSEGWTARVRAHRPDAAAAERLSQVLGPEVEREIPRCRAVLNRPDPRTVEIEVTAAESGAIRAAMNAYLGWIRLALDAEGVAERLPARPAPAG